MNNAQIQFALNVNGFPCGAADGIIGPKTRDATTRFQQACNMRQLTIDGIPGGQTQEALGLLPYLSPHFVVAELRSHGNGDCYVNWQLLAALEKLREVTGSIYVIDAYRDPAHNSAVGGATSSMHLHGLAADTGGGIALATVLEMQLFSGIGIRNNVVRHVDLRHLSSANKTPGATPQNPARWTYN